MAVPVAEAFARRRERGNRIDAETCPAWAHEGQRGVWDSEALDVVVCSGTQGGKTALDAPLLLREIARTAKYYNQLADGAGTPMSQANYIVIGPTLELLRRQAIPYIRQEFIGKHKIGVMNGADSGRPQFRLTKEEAQRLCGVSVPVVVHFLSGEDPDAAESLTALAAMWDEAGQDGNKESTFRAIKRRLGAARTLGAKLGIPLGRMWYTTTPYEWGWFKSAVVDFAIRGEEGYSYHTWRSWDNPGGISEEVARKELETGMEEWEWEQMYLGKWNKPKGAIFASFDPVISNWDDKHETNVVRPFDIPKDWIWHVGLDFGSQNTAAVMVAESPQGVFYITATYHAAGEPDIHAEQINAFLDGKERGMIVGGAPSEGQTRKDYGLAGLPVAAPNIKGDKSALWVGIGRLQRAFSTRRLKMFSTCRRLIDDTTNYSRILDADGHAQQAIKDKEKFHLIDSARYIIGTIFRGAEVHRESKYARPEVSSPEDYPLPPGVVRVSRSGQVQSA